MAFRERKKPKEEEMNLVPMMNLMTVLIPFLLSITAFSKITIIDIALPEERGSQTMTKQVKKPKKKEEKLNLTIIISDLGITVGAKGGFLPTIFTKEKWKFKDETVKPPKVYTIDVDSNIRKEMRENRSVYVKQAGRRMTMFERTEIILYAVEKENINDPGKIIKTLHNSAGEMLVKPDFYPILKSNVNVGDTLINLNKYVKYKRIEEKIAKLEDEIAKAKSAYEKKSKQQDLDELKKQKARIKYMVIVKNPNIYIDSPMSAYDYLLTVLLRVREMYATLPDIDEIIISAEDQIIYDIIVQILDIARLAGFKKLMFAKLRV